MTPLSLRLQSTPMGKTLTLTFSSPPSPPPMAVLVTAFRGRARLSTAGPVRASRHPLSGMDDALMGFISGKTKATELAHSIWENVVRKGDVVVDATCGNGHDTFALLKMVADESVRGCVYGLDIQNSAVEYTSSLLDASLEPKKRELVKLLCICHSKMEDIIPKSIPIRLVAFNLGYLPGGDKAVITKPQTTLLALQAASRIIESGGLISVMVYIGHPGGREELETVQAFASHLPTDTWTSCRLETLNRPTAPVLVLVFKK
ncbi:hypothetical protein QJS04_geneDACA023742 [Acorus gramineus]|uniref:rRNA methylase YtqB n=1 Tax=Acorus gramineus TaxID=55184 RepID=A0AAV9BRI2_ACOGR|nr:hypothetical protein QJS04_geneDACA023742 [Acorus gramineus]